MRGARALIVIAIALILAGVALTYREQKAAQIAGAPKAPKALPAHLSSKAENWDWSKTENGRTVVRVLAKTFQQVTDTSKFDVEGVHLSLSHKDNDKIFDKVKRAKAEYDTTTGMLFSEGDVEITMGISEENAKPTGKLLVIKSSGVKFDSKNGKAVTGNRATFTFDRGDGQSTGAEYDPTTRELHLLKDVTLHWKGVNPTDKTMEVQAGELIYKEREAKVYMSPWSKLKRDTLTMEGADSVVTLHEGAIQLVEAEHAHGVDVDPKRKVDYAADHLRMDFGDDGEITKIVGDQNAKLISSSDFAATTVTSNRVDLEFDSSEKGAVLSKASGNGNTVVDSRPIPKPNVLTADSRIMKSDVVLLAMKPGGQEIADVETPGPGTIEFLPNRPGQKHRLMTGDRLWVTYGAQNQIQNFRSINVTTRTDNEAPKGKPPAAPSLTWSKELQAEFDAKGQMTRMEQ